MSLVPPAEMSPHADMPLPPTTSAGAPGLYGRARGTLRNPFSAIGLGILAVLILAAVFAPLLTSYDPTGFNGADKFMAPGSQHFFGTDDVGRDIFSRVLFGARYSLAAGMVILLVAASIGTLVGLVAGYAGGWVDEALMRATDMFLAFPALILAMCVAAALGPSLVNATLATAIVWWPWYARLVRGQVLQLKTRRSWPPRDSRARAVPASSSITCCATARRRSSSR